METYLDAVIEAEYVDYDEGQYALVSAAIIDSVINGISYPLDEEDNFEWATLEKCVDCSILKEKAVKAIDAVLSDNSELRALWEENQELYEAWREDKISMQNGFKVPVRERIFQEECSEVLCSIFCPDGTLV